MRSAVLKDGRKLEREDIHATLSLGAQVDGIAKTDRYSEGTLYRMRATVNQYGALTAPANRPGPDPKLTPFLRGELCHLVSVKPDIVRREMVAFVHQSCGAQVSLTNITGPITVYYWALDDFAGGVMIKRYI